MEEKRNKKIVHVGYMFASPIRVQFEKARHQAVEYDRLDSLDVREMLYKSLINV